MRKLVMLLLLVGACGRSDIGFSPGAPVVERELELDDGDVVWVEVHAGDDNELRTSFLAVRDGVSLVGLVDAIALGKPAALVLDTTGEPVLVVEVDHVARAFIWR